MWKKFSHKTARSPFMSKNVILITALAAYFLGAIIMYGLARISDVSPRNSLAFAVMWPFGLVLVLLSGPESEDASEE